MTTPHNVMAREAEDGGPAFPCPRVTGQFRDPGMSLRDWFAGQALIGMLASRAVYPASDWGGMADEAYDAADAMLKKREGSP